MIRFSVHVVSVIGLTLLSQLGGVAWLIALAFKRRFMAFLLAYATLSLLVVWAAPQFGRTALPCFSNETMGQQSWAYCALNRHYVTPEMKTVLEDLAQAVTTQFPGTKVQFLDAGFPFVTGFPLLPHLSHDDGQKADIALFYNAPGGAYLPGETRSPIGYFAFEDGASSCPPTWLTLRWNMPWLQSFFAALDLNIPRNRFVVNHLANDPRVGKVFVEPHLVEKFGVHGAKIRFQGCRAARHDDHIHVQL